MYRKIKAQVPVTRQYAATLAARGVVSAAEVEAIKAQIEETLQKAYADKEKYKRTADEWMTSQWMADNGPSAPSRACVSGPLHTHTHIRTHTHTQPLRAVTFAPLFQLLTMWGVSVCFGLVRWG
jgi:2-oxoglutarate dehydrogenase complex dehydrogenase (E1) component-like enzyme